ncbi:AraC family transcriptional regulator [Halomonas sp. DP8Y7-3]|uniref:AraC family transcriptional regulator n=1 Tax=Halomonas sp. DP8Y7-3 TaxID=2859079 RepID=UPI001C974D7B|nr:AraC family transcriptional regulator [Halomonas sp. DP8Y7-3]MBY5929605.1 AraC family transcriptional regulator [Halomonas sp. DP8Y7-3]
MQPMVRAAALTGYPTLLSELGGSAHQALARLSLPGDYLDRPDRLIPVATKIDLLELGAQLSGCRHFGLLLGRHQNISMLGMVGLLIQQCDTLREAMVTIADQIGRHVQGLEVRLEERDDQAHYHFTYRVPGYIRPSRQHNDNTLMGAYNILTFLYGEPIKLRAVYLCGEEPKDLEPYTQQFHAALRFNHPENTLVFDRHCLDHAIAGGSPALRRLINSLLHRHRWDDIESKVEWIITNLLPLDQVSLEAVATALDVPPRTLQDRLLKRGLSFQHLLDRVRMRSAQVYMLDTHLSLTEIADLLGYSQLSALTRSFKRVMGESPAQWRRKHKAETVNIASFVK